MVRELKHVHSFVERALYVRVTRYAIRSGDSHTPLTVTGQPATSDEREII